MFRACFKTVCLCRWTWTLSFSNTVNKIWKGVWAVVVVLLLGQFYYPSFENTVQMVKGWDINSINSIHACKKNALYCFSTSDWNVCWVCTEFFLHLWRCEIWSLWFLMKETGLSIYPLPRLSAWEITLWKTLPESRNYINSRSWDKQGAPLESAEPVRCKNNLILYTNEET